MKVAIVNDLKLACEALRRIVQSLPGFEVVWTAYDGAQAVQKCAEARPDIVLMDLLMPVMDGVEATRRIMKESPCAILVVTATVSGNRDLVFDAMGHGALDAVNTPVLGMDGNIGGAGEFRQKLLTVSQLVAVPPSSAAKPAGSLPPGTWKAPLVLLGASTGGPQALAAVLSALPENYPAAVVIAQHVDQQFAPGLAAWLDERCRLPVKIATPGDPLRPGVVRVAGTNDHLILDPDGCLYYTKEPKETAYRPSVDVLFYSATRLKCPRAGVLLTGMGKDGADGLLALKNSGALTIAQDEASSVVFGMPKAAIQSQAAKEVLSLAKIGPRLASVFAAS
jgi:chemotaxis response regulator CheB